ncbi:MAG: segregation and condensation protein A [Alphaproteobacteria bacterium]
MENISPPPNNHFHLTIEGFTGPLDLLLSLAKAQKLDLTNLSMTELADQYLAFLNHYLENRSESGLLLEQAADYLVMATFLAWLKSRLLLPPSPQPLLEENATEAASILADQLQKLDKIRQLANNLNNQPQLYQSVFPTAGEMVIRYEWKLRVSLASLVDAYRLIQNRGQIFVALQRHELITAAEGKVIISQWLKKPNKAPCNLLQLASEKMASASSSLLRQSGLCALLSAALDMAKGQELEIRQEKIFAPIWLHSIQQPNN